jgi:hypothetical protein
VTPKSGTTDRYAAAMGELWVGLARTLRRLEVIAGEPDRLDDDAAIGTLRRLQYRLHVACEHAYGLQPPARAQHAHADLAGALAAARDATAEVVEAASLGGAVAVEPLVPEWRCALFAVRLARLHLAEPATAAPAPPARGEHDDDGGGGEIVRPLAAFLLALVGALAFAIGAALGDWPVWIAGLGGVIASLVAYRP